MKVEGVRHHFRVFRECVQDNILELDCMIRQATNEAVMELRQKVFLFHLNQQHNSYCPFVKCLNGFCHYLSLDHVVFQEAEATD